LRIGGAARSVHCGHMPASASDRDLIARHRAGDRRARTTLIERHLPLARGLALRYRHSGEPLDDLIQVASVGLIKAVDRWDPERGNAFSSFAMPTILGELRRHFRDATWTVRPPRGLQERTLTLERARQRLVAASGREPALEELAEALNEPPARVAEALQARGSRWTLSLESSVVGDPDDPLTLGEQLGAEEPGFARAEARVTLERLLSGLDRRAREILRLVYAEGLTQAQVGERVGCTQVHVSRLVRGSLARLALHAA
jgi:RNA polymerase sigma-B factor